MAYSLKNYIFIINILSRLRKLYHQVVRVHCKQRIAASDFVTAVRTTLAAHFDKRDEIVGKC